MCVCVSLCVSLCVCGTLCLHSGLLLLIVSLLLLPLRYLCAASLYFAVDRCAVLLVAHCRNCWCFHCSFSCFYVVATGVLILLLWWCWSWLWFDGAGAGVGDKAVAAVMAVVVVGRHSVVMVVACDIACCEIASLLCFGTMKPRICHGIVSTSIMMYCCASLHLAEARVPLRSQPVCNPTCLPATVF